MTALLPLLMVVIIFVCMATLYSEGMWSNAIRLINAVTAALVATNYFEPLARWLDNKLSAGTYAWDFLALWILFAVVFGILRSTTDAISRIRVQFPLLADQIGGGFFALWTSWVVICFTMMSLHTAPLSRNFLFGGFQPEQRMLGFAPIGNGWDSCRRCRWGPSAAGPRRRSSRITPMYPTRMPTRSTLSSMRAALSDGSTPPAETISQTIWRTMEPFS